MIKKLELFETDLPVIQITNRSKYDYDYLGSGDEGYVRAYDEKTAYKFFFSFKSVDHKIFKLQKIEHLARLSDPSFAFPEGFVKFESSAIEGYYMKRNNHS